MSWLKKNAVDPRSLKGLVCLNTCRDKPLPPPSRRSSSRFVTITITITITHQMATHLISARPPMVIPPFCHEHVASQHTFRDPNRCFQAHQSPDFKGDRSGDSTVQKDMRATTHEARLAFSITPISHMPVSSAHSPFRCSGPHVLSFSNYSLPSSSL